MTEPADVPVRHRRTPAERAVRWTLPGCGAVWTAAAILHATGVPWLDITLGTTAAAAVTYGRIRHRAEGRSAEAREQARRHARHAAAGIGLAGGWTALAARLGPAAGPYLAVTDLWAGLSAYSWWWGHRHPAVLQARGWRAEKDDWNGWRARRWGLAGSHLLASERTRLGRRYVADTKGTGKRASQLARGDIAERIAEVHDLPPSRVEVKAHRLAGRLEISIRETDPWAHPIPHPAVTPDHEVDLSGPYSITQPAIVGQDPETGRRLELLLCRPTGGRNISVVAILDAGKTVLLSCISERVTKAPDALLFRINLSIKGDAERHLWGPACHLTALGPREGKRALLVLRVLAAITEWRAQQPKATANWEPSPDDPHLVLVIDEIDALSEIPACRAVLQRLSSKGREYGITIVRAGQRGTAEWTGGGNIRAMDGVFCIGAVNRSAEAMHAAGDLGLQLPDMASYGDGRPGVWAIAELGGRHEAGRTFDLSEPGDIRSIVAGRARHQPELKPELKAFLGKTYEELLSTDVFARWARDQQEPAPAAAHPRPDMPAATPDGTLPAAVATATDTLDAYDQEVTDALDPELRARLRRMDERNAETRRTLEEASAMPVPDLTHDQLVTAAAAQWRALGEATEIPAEARETMLRLLAAGTTIGKLADALAVTKWTARKYLERLRTEGLVRMEGEKRTARWLLTEPGDGDGS